MTMESEALKEINELKAQLGPFIKAASKMKEFNHDKPPIVHFKHWDALNKSPAQCLKQHDLDLLNSIKDEFINSNQSCELILASRINSMELNNE